MLADAPRHLHEEGVAGAVAHAVVDQLEAVEVEEHHREVALRSPFAAAIALREVLVEARAVGQARQAVVEGDVLQARLGAAPRRDVLHLHDEAPCRGARLVEEARVQRHHTSLPSWWRQRSSLAKASIRGGARGQLAAKRARVVGVHERVEALADQRFLALPEARRARG